MPDARMSVTPSIAPMSRDGVAQGLLAVAEVAAEREHRGQFDAHPLEAGHQPTANPARCAVGSAAGDLHRDVVERHRDRRVGLVHGHGDELRELVREHGLRDALGNRLDEVDRVALDRGDDLLGELAVVDGAVQVVGLGGILERDVHGHVDHEHLPVALLVLEHAVVPRGAKPGEDDLVERIHRSPPVQACQTSRAVRVAGTSCTRTPHAPGLRGERAGHRGREVALGRRGAVRCERGEEPLARGADEHGMPERLQLVEPAEQRPVVLRRLREPDAGIEDDAARVDTPHEHLGEPRLELGAHIRDDVVVGRQASMSVLWPRQCIAM